MRLSRNGIFLMLSIREETRVLAHLDLTLEGPDHVLEGTGSEGSGHAEEMAVQFLMQPVTSL